MDNNISSPNSQGKDTDLAKKLWEFSLILTGEEESQIRLQSTVLKKQIWFKCVTMKGYTGSVHVKTIIPF